MAFSCAGGRVGDRYSRYSCRPVYPGRVHLCAFIRVTPDGITRWTGVAASGVVLFGIALVFTFNALVAIMQFVADEDTLQAGILDDGEPRPRVVGKNWAYWRGVYCCAFCALRSARQLTVH